MEKYFILLTAGIISGAIGQVLLKSGANESLPLIPGTGSLKTLLFSIIIFLKNYKILLALLLYGLGFFLWIFVLTKFELSYALPIMSSTYIIVMVLSWIFLGEDINTLRIIGTILITLGIALIIKGA